MKKRYLIGISMLLAMLLFSCTTDQQLIAYEETSYNFTSYTKSDYSRVAAENIHIYTSRLDMTQEYIEVGVLELKYSMNAANVKELGGYYGATALYKKNSTNYLLLRNKNYQDEQTADDKANRT